MKNAIDIKEDTAHPMQDALRRWLWVALFAAAFAWVESSVVVYLREIYFGGSFGFPIVTAWEQGKLIVDGLMKIELGREVATILMLVAAGCLAGTRNLNKFCFFMIAFGIWDIFYYVWLWVMIGWPESLMTWDLLFLIPLPWVGPVITPVLISLAMITAGSLIIFYQEKGFSIGWRWFDWVIIMGCAFLMVVAFCWDWKNIMRIPDGAPYSGMPNPFAWWLFIPAYLFSLGYFGWRFKQILSGNR